MDKEESLHTVFIDVMKLHCLRSYSLCKEMGLHPGQQHLLFSLYEKDGQIQRELANALKIKPATMTVMIKRTEKNGLVRRQQDKNDQRVWRVFITEKGKETCEKAKIAGEQLEGECFENFTVEEKVLLRRFLLQMKNNLSDKVDISGFEFSHKDE